MIFYLFIDSTTDNSFGLILPDSIGFHQDAKILANVMNDFGLRIWSLKPEKCGTACYDEMVAITSLVYYFIFPHPISMLFFNALVQSLVVFIIFLIFNMIVKNQKIVFYSSVLFLFFPSQFLYLSQIQRDGIFSLAIILYLYLIINFFFRLKNNKTQYLLEYIKIFFLSGFILLIVSSTRHYYIQILNLFVFLIFLIQISYYLFNYRKNFNFYIFLQPILIAFSIIYFSFFFNFNYMKQHSYLYFVFQKILNIELYTIEDKADLVFLEISKQKSEKINNNDSVENISDLEIKKNSNNSEDLSNLNNDENLENVSNSSNSLNDKKNDISNDFVELTEYEYFNNLQSYKNFEIIRNASWTRIKWIPEIIDNKIKELSFARLGFLSQKGRTSLDNEIQFKNSLDVFLYIPRAIQIGLYSPFPNLIFDGSNNITFNKILMSITFSESILAFIISVLFIFYFKKIYFKIENFVLINFCISNIIIFCLTVNNVGTILRMRYIFFGLLICFIIASIINHKSKFIKN